MQSRSQPSPVPPEQSQKPSNGGILATVLLVDDNEADIEFARISFEEMWPLKCNLLFARDGEEALNILRTHGSIDLIVLDINMPGIDGLALLRQRLRENESLQQCPIIMYSSLDDGKQIGMAKWLGADAYLRKPLDFQELQRAVAGMPTLQWHVEDDKHFLRKAQ